MGSVFFLISTALASPTDFYGFGGQSIAQGGGGVASISGSAAAFLNPAGLTGLDRPEVLYGAGIVRFQTPEMPTLFWDTNRDGAVNEFDEGLSYNATPDSADGAMVAFSAPVTDRIDIGAGLFLPIAHITRFQTFDPELPNYFMLENRLHRYAMAFGGGIKLPKGFSIGAGGRFLVRAPLAIHFTIDAGLSAEDASSGAEDFVGAEIDVHTIDLRLEADMVPTIGFQWDLGEISETLRGLRLGGVARGEASMAIDVIMDGQINAALVDAGELNSTTLALIYYSKVQVLDHYLPAQAQGGLAYSPHPAVDLHADVQATNWAAMELNIAQIEDTIIEASLADIATSEIVDGNPIDVSFRNTLSVRTGVELHLPEWQLGSLLGRVQLIPRAGFSYIPSPLVSQSAQSALLDSDRLLIAAGLGFVHHTAILGTERQFDWDLFGQVHTLAPGSLSRDSSGQALPGYPQADTSLPIGGNVFVAGIQGRYQY
ncbi:MAG: outer membrane protein transport protein [Myxococcota bacterium]|nr:outer membrane protein transport protein [Myxococcota bacterium]